TNVRRCPSSSPIRPVAALAERGGGCSLATEGRTASSAGAASAAAGDGDSPCPAATRSAVRSIVTGGRCGFPRALSPLFPGPLLPSSLFPASAAMLSSIIVEPRLYHTGY